MGHTKKEDAKENVGRNADMHSGEKERNVEYKQTNRLKKKNYISFSKRAMGNSRREKRMCTAQQTQQKQGRNEKHKTGLLNTTTSMMMTTTTKTMGFVILILKCAWSSTLEMERNRDTEKQRKRKS